MQEYQQPFQPEPVKDPRIAHRQQYCCFIRKQILKKICGKSSKNYNDDSLQAKDIQALSNHWTMVELTTQLDAKLDLQDMLLMAFLTKNYLKKFGQNWADIAAFIEMENIFELQVTGEVVQKVYRLIQRFEKNKEVQTINQWSKDSLLFSYPGMKGEMQYKTMQRKQPMHIEEQAGFDFDNYDEMVKEAATAPNLSERIEDQFEEYARPILVNIINDMIRFPKTKSNTTFEKISRVLSKFNQKAHPAKVTSAPIHIQYSIADSIKIVKNMLQNEEFKEKKSYQTLVRERMTEQFRTNLKNLLELKESINDSKKPKPKK